MSLETGASLTFSPYIASVVNSFRSFVTIYSNSWTIDNLCVLLTLPVIFDVCVRACVCVYVCAHCSLDLFSKQQIGDIFHFSRHQDLTFLTNLKMSNPVTGINKKNISKCRLLKILHRVPSVNLEKPEGASFARYMNVRDTCITCGPRFIALLYMYYGKCPKLYFLLFICLIFAFYNI